jgi:hypothetical protein
MKVAELVVRALVNEHVTTVFGIPGEENIELMGAFRSSSIRFILTRHEQAAAFMAAVYRRLAPVFRTKRDRSWPYGANPFRVKRPMPRVGRVPMVLE